MKGIINLVLVFSTLLLCSCASMHKVNSSQAPMVNDAPRETLVQVRESFVKVRTIMFATSGCVEPPPSFVGCSEPMRLGQGHMSGSVIRTPSGRIGIITAAHGINVDPDSFLSNIPPALRVNLRLMRAIQLQYADGTEVYADAAPICDNINDICFLTSHSIPTSIRPLSISPLPAEWGDIVWYAGNPLSVADTFPGILPLFWGHYSGDPNTRNRSTSIYTVFAAPGSSGSPILNASGDLVGIVQAVYVRLPLITISLSHNSLISFLNTIDGPTE